MGSIGTGPHYSLGSLQCPESVLSRGIFWGTRQVSIEMNPPVLKWIVDGPSGLNSVFAILRYACVIRCARVI